MAERKRIALLLSVGLGEDNQLEIVGAYPTRAHAERAQDARERDDKLAGRRAVYEVACPLWNPPAQRLVHH